MPKKRGSDYKTKRRNLWKPKSAKRNADGKIIVNNIYIGAGNAQRWFILKKKLGYTSDKDFVTYLLDLAEQQAGLNECVVSRQLDNQDKEDIAEQREYEETNDSLSSEAYDTRWKSVNLEDTRWKAVNHDDEPLRRSTRKQAASHHIHVRRSSRNNRVHGKKKRPPAEEATTSNSGDEGDDRRNEGPPMLKAESPLPPTTLTYGEMPTLEIDEPSPNVLPPTPPRHVELPVPTGQQPGVLVGERVKLKRRGKRKWTDEIPTKQKHVKRKRKDTESFPTRGGKSHDIRRAPRNGIPAHSDGGEPGTRDVASRTGVVASGREPVSQQHVPREERLAVPQRVAIKIKLCGDCGTRHLQDACPLLQPPLAIADAPARPSDSRPPDIEPSLAVSSLPHGFQLQEIEPAHGLSVVTCCPLPRFTQLGPLLGQPVKEMDIPDDFNMRDIWDLSSGTERVYVSTEDLESSNWLRFMRPAPTRAQRNVAPVVRDRQLLFHTLSDIPAGEELLYWGDHAHWGGKRAEKTNCGGCNLRFSHPLYYRMHCAVFHDPNFSLTIRKYHCKVCGATVLGKEHIMRHASEQHAGRGAYRCQFCSKFFLRLNYLEMHRTYGCAANPGRTRPLCDFCGRKFCQPQKLKVHIKRMHSDMASVLREFQCKSCLKLLGSRAALQRHAKEVHHKEAVGAVGCSRCGKTFQNKSNLKIHMLTHSGVKPFKCRESSCNAAFTTKQCLQFHYKKVHSFSELSMPPIVRSVEYTFAAYSGGAPINRRKEIASDEQSDDSILSQGSSVDIKHGEDDSQNQPSKATPPTSGHQSPVAFSNYLKKKRPTPPTSDDQASMSYSSQHEKHATSPPADDQTPASNNASPLHERVTPIADEELEHEQNVSAQHSPAVYDSRCCSPSLHARLESTESCNMNFNSNSKDSDSTAVETKLICKDGELPSGSLCPTINRYTCSYSDKDMHRGNSPPPHDSYSNVYQGSNSPTLQGYPSGYKSNSPLMQEGYSSPPLEEGYVGSFKTSQDGYPTGYGKVVVSKGSKKWLGEGVSGPLSPMCSSEIAYEFQEDKLSAQDDNDDAGSKRKLRGKLSTASLLVEAALVAAERDILSDTPSLAAPSMREDLDTMYSLHRRSPPVKPRHFLLCKAMQPEPQSFVQDDDEAQPAGEPRHFLHEDDNAHHFLRDDDAAQRHFMRDSENTQHDTSYGLHYQEEVLSPEPPGRGRVEYINQRLNSPPESPVRGYELQPLSSDEEDISVAENLSLVKNKNLYELTPERGESRFELVSDVQGLDMSRSNYQSAYHSHRWSGVYGASDQQTVDLSVSGPAYPEVLRVVGRVSHPLPYPPFPLPSPPYPPGPPYHPYQHYY